VAAGVTYLTPNKLDFYYEQEYNIPMKKKRTPEERERMRIAFWQKWAGTMPADNLVYTNGIVEDEWYNSDITKPCDESHIKSV
jgi:hypothetical protein